MLEGHYEGIKFYMTPQIDRLGDAQVREKLFQCLSWRLKIHTILSGHIIGGLQSF
jgi:hypothetical protein